MINLQSILKQNASTLGTTGVVSSLTLFLAQEVSFHSLSGSSTMPVSVPVLPLRVARGMT